MYERDVQRLHEDLAEGVSSPSRSASTSATWSCLRCSGGDAYGRQGARRAHPRRGRRGGRASSETSASRPYSSATIPPREIYIRLKHKAAAEVGIRRTGRPSGGQTTRGGAARARRAAERRRRDRRPPRAAAAARAHRRGPSHPRDRPGEGHRRPASTELRASSTSARPAHVAATPAGVMALLEEYDVPLEGARAVVVGRSDIVGKPARHAAPAGERDGDVCHSRTKDLAAVTREADILVVAVGRAGACQRRARAARARR